MSLTDYLTQTGSQAQTAVGGQTGTNMTAYNPAQQGLQSDLGGMYNQLLQGNIPQSFTNPAAATSAYQNNFNQQVAPGIAAQYGGGSNQMASQQALGLSNLQGQLYNTGVSNFMNALGGGSNYAFQGQGNTTGQSNISATDTSTTNSNQINPLVFLSSLLGNALISSP